MVTQHLRVFEPTKDIELRFVRRRNADDRVITVRMFDVEPDAEQLGWMPFDFLVSQLSEQLQLDGFGRIVGLRVVHVRILSGVVGFLACPGADES